MEVVEIRHRRAHASGGGDSGTEVRDDGGTDDGEFHVLCLIFSVFKVLQFIIQTIEVLRAFFTGNNIMH